MAASVLRQVLVCAPRLLQREKCLLINNSSHYRFLSFSSQLLSDLLYSEKHEWIKTDNGVGTIGITDYAQEKLGEIVFVQLPEVESELEIDGEAGVLESVKAASEIYTPVSGKVVEVNDKVTETPSLINNSCMDEGWLYKVNLSQPDELKSLLTEEQYKNYIETQE